MTFKECLLRLPIFALPSAVKQQRENDQLI